MGSGDGRVGSVGEGGGEKGGEEHVCEHKGTRKRELERWAKLKRRGKNDKIGTFLHIFALVTYF